jgi:23S rRNA A1618 N6-methylase RlmF
MAEKNSNDETNKLMFTQLVMMLSTSAMQQMGKLVNPLTRKTEVDLDGAQMTIDMLTMIRDKTRGNLDKDEDQILSSIISSLQMNYVETMQSPPPPKDKTEAKAEPAAETKDEGKKVTQEKTPPKEDKDPKFHKSYGD